MDINNVIEFVIPYYKGKDIMHDLSHINRVLMYVDKILKEKDYKVDIEVIKLAAYFHGFVYKNEEEIRNYLSERNFDSEAINKIILVAWESQKSELPKTLEGKILHDAHMIEGGKVYLVVKSLVTGSVRGQTLEETISYIENNIIDKGKCYLPEAELIYQEQQHYTKNFILDLKKGLML